MKPEQALNVLAAFIARAQALPAHVMLATGAEWVTVAASVQTLQQHLAAQAKTENASAVPEASAE